MNWQHSLFLFLFTLLFFQSCEGFIAPKSNNVDKFNRSQCISSSQASSSSSTISLKSSSSIIKDGVKVEQVELSSGVLAEVMSSLPSHQEESSSSLVVSPFEWLAKQIMMGFVDTSKENRLRRPKPPLVFIHGSFHASWCWAEHFFAFFQNLGYPCYALSLRGTGGTFAGEGVSRVKISEHVHDVTAFLSYVVQQQQQSSSSSLPPIIIGHSFGGMPIMKYLEANNDPTLKDKLSGVVLLSSVPPSGNGKMTMRFLKRSLSDSWKVTAGLAMKKVITDDDLCRTLFFGGEKEILGGGDTTTTTVVVDDRGISDDNLHRIQSYFQRDTVATIALRDLATQLPSKNMDAQGRAPFLNSSPPALVIGASDDFIVDKEGVEETAIYFGTTPVIVDSPHDVMLGNKWKNTANAINDWIETIL